MALASLLPLGCGPSDSNPDAPVDAGGHSDSSTNDCRLRDYYDGPAEDVAAEVLRVGEMKEEVFVPFEAGGDATFVFGFQGGVMIQPVVELDPSRVNGEPCVWIEFRHRPDPDFPDNAGELSFFAENAFIDTLRLEDGRYRGGAYADQMGWSAADGVRMVFEAEVRGADWAVRTELPLRVVDVDGWDECDVVPTTLAAGCELVELAGTITVDSVGELSEPGCDVMTAVTLTMAPVEQVVPEGCYALTRTLDVERSCIESQELTAGATLEERTWVFAADPEATDCYESFGIAQGACSCP